MGGGEGPYTTKDRIQILIVGNERGCLTSGNGIEDGERASVYSVVFDDALHTGRKARDLPPTETYAGGLCTIVSPQK